MYCAPRKKNQQNGTCFDLDQLERIAKILDNSLPNNRPIGGKTKTKQELHQKIKGKLQPYCQDDETCWIHLPFIRNKLKEKDIEDTFRPLKPLEWNQNKFTWLNTDDIANVMSQYQDSHEDFIFFGPVPADCPIGWDCELTNANPIKLNQAGYQKIGIIFNLDDHDEPGSHWTAVYISCPDHSIEYFDSYGENPEPSIQTFLEKWCKSWNDVKVPMKIHVNQERFQYGNSECGMFSMYYIIQRLNGLSRIKVLTGGLNDTLMNQLRNVLYRPLPKPLRK